MKKQSTRQWVNERLAIDISDERLKTLWEFVALWNIFEAGLFEKRFSVLKIEKIDWTLEDDVLEKFLKFARGRYVDEHAAKVNSRFEKLKLGDEHKKLVETILTSNISDACDIQKALILIVARYRNNLFHGEKSLSHFMSYMDVFPFACEFLIECIKAND